MPCVWLAMVSLIRQNIDLSRVKTHRREAGSIVADCNRKAITTNPMSSKRAVILLKMLPLWRTPWMNTTFMIEILDWHYRLK